MHQYLTRVFKSGNSQAVRLPREFRMEQEEVYIRREGMSIVITPLPQNWDGFLEGCDALSDDFSVSSTKLPSDVKRDTL